MAGKPTKLKGKYYSRVYIRLGKNRWKEKLVHLGTANKLEAEARMVFVRQAEGAIKQGLDVSFPWYNEKGSINIERYLLNDAINDYLKYKRAERLKESSIERIYVALKHFTDTVGKSFPVSDITIEHIDFFKERFSTIKRHKSNTINNNLTKIGTFLNWLFDRNKISVLPKIKKVKVGVRLPKYLTDSEWYKIMNLDYVIRKHCNYREKLDEHWKKAFYFYRETGCRLSEPFRGRLDGNWLIIEPDKYKTGRTREIYIPDELVEIVLEMKERVKLSGAKNLRDCIQTYSKKFKYACDTIGINKHLHCLRNTFAVRRYLETGNIYDVAKELGHSTVKTTEIYSDFDKRRLQQDFPTIISKWKLEEKLHNHPESYTNHRIQLELQSNISVGKV